MIGGTPLLGGLPAGGTDLFGPPGITIAITGGLVGHVTRLCGSAGSSRDNRGGEDVIEGLSLIHISEPTRLL